MTKINYKMNLEINAWFAILAPFIAFFITCWVNLKFLYKKLNLTFHV